MNVLNPFAYYYIFSVKIYFIPCLFRVVFVLDFFFFFFCSKRYIHGLYQLNI